MRSVFVCNSASYADVSSLARAYFDYDQANPKNILVYLIEQKVKEKKKTFYCFDCFILRLYFVIIDACTVTGRLDSKIIVSNWFIKFMSVSVFIKNNMMSAKSPQPSFEKLL